MITTGVFRPRASSLSQGWDIWNVQGSTSLGHRNGPRSLDNVCACDGCQHVFKENESILLASSTVWQHQACNIDYCILDPSQRSSLRPSWHTWSSSVSGTGLKALQSLFHLILMTTCEVDSHSHFKAKKTGTGSQELARGHPRSKTGAGSPGTTLTNHNAMRLHYTTLEGTLLMSTFVKGVVFYFPSWVRGWVTVHTSFLPS